MSLDPDVMAARLRSYAQAIADDQDVTLEAVLEAMRTALADLTHQTTCRLCHWPKGWPFGLDSPPVTDSATPTAVMIRIDPQDVTNV